MTTEYVKVDRGMLEELLKEISELKRLAKEQLNPYTKTQKKRNQRKKLEELK